MANVSKKMECKNFRNIVIDQQVIEFSAHNLPSKASINFHVHTDVFEIMCYTFQSINIIH